HLVHPRILIPDPVWPATFTPPRNLPDAKTLASHRPGPRPPALGLASGRHPAAGPVYVEDKAAAGDGVHLGTGRDDPNEIVSRVTVAARWSSWAVRVWFVRASRQPPGWVARIGGGAGRWRSAASASRNSRDRAGSWRACWRPRRATTAAAWPPWWAVSASAMI